MKRTARAPAQPESNTIRCAIYTRKSTEEGLEQAFILVGGGDAWRS